MRFDHETHPRHCIRRYPRQAARAPITKRKELTVQSMLLFPVSEYRQRVDRARALMREANLDALLVSAPNNLTYISGYRTNLFDSNFRPFLCLLSLDGE